MRIRKAYPENPCTLVLGSVKVAGIFAIWMLVKAEVDINVMLVVILAIVVILLLIAPVTSIFSKL